MAWVDSILGGGVKKKKKAPRTPLGPGDLVPVAFWEGRAIRTKPVTAVKSQPRQLCGRSELSAPSSHKCACVASPGKKIHYNSCVL